MEELTEVITAADFHPSHCNIMMYSTSRGAIKLGDMRQAALCDQYCKVYEEQEDPETRSFFSEIIASISDIKFSPDGRYIIARDFLTLKVWDVNMDSRPVQTINVSRSRCALPLHPSHADPSRVSGSTVDPRAPATAAVRFVRQRLHF